MNALIKFGLIGTVAAIATAASATPLVLSGNFLEVGISDAGTFGSDGNTSPGILHDPTGMRNYGNNDYLTPGSPHDGFTVASDQFSGTNDNYFAGGDFGSASPTLLTGAAARGYANAASWTGGNGFVTVTNSYFYNPGDQRILVSTTLTALSDLTNLAFARSNDPDPDVNTFGSFATNNQRGNALFGIDDFVSGSGPLTGLTLALVNLDTNGFTHTTEVNFACCSNISPYDVLAHNGDASDPLNDYKSFGDYGLNLAYSIGTLATGDSVTLNYAYAVGSNVQVTGGGTPEPATWAMMLVGFGGVGAVMRRRATKVTFA